MRRFFALFLSIASMTTSAFSAYAAEDDRTTHDRNIVLEDKTCYDLNRAYERVQDSGRWTANIYKLYPNGNSKLYLQMRVIDRRFFTKIENGTWISYPRLPIRLTIDGRSGLPVFTACEYKGVETVNGEPALRYSADWRRNGWEASVETWVSRVSGKFVKTISRYKEGHAEFSFPIALQTMDYERGNASEPLNLNQ